MATIYRSQPKLLPLLSAALLASVIGACNQSSNNDPDECFAYQCYTTDQYLYACYSSVASGLVYSCQDNNSDATDWCVNNVPGGSAGGGPTHIPCSSNLAAGTGDTGDTGGVDPWDPALYISFNSQTEVYEIDEQFVQALDDDSFRQLGLDSARLDAVGSSGPNYGCMKLVNVQSGDLADELGLQTNDILKSVNGYNLDALDGRVSAYVALKTETEFLLTIDRSGNTVRLSYEFVN